MQIAVQGIRVAAGMLVCAFLFCSVHARGPSTAEERAEVIEHVRMLERDPLRENAEAARTELKDWTIEVPEIRFYRCDGLLGAALDDYPYAHEFNDQVILSGAAFTLEHQDKMREPVAAYIAGVEGALRMYEVLRRSRPDASSVFLDDLITMRERGALAAHITGLANERCAGSNSLLPAFAAATAFDLVIASLIGWLFARRRHQSFDVAVTSAAHAGFVSRAQWIVFACAAYYATIIAALHFLEPGYDPRYRFVSEYQWSGHGCLMNTTFFVLALAALTLALILRKVYRSAWSARLGFGLLALGSIGIAVAGIFRGFPLHDVGSAIGLPSILMATLFYSWSFRRSSDWTKVFLPSVVIAFAMLGVFIPFAAGIWLPGLHQRAFLGLFLVWIAVVAHRAARLQAVSI
jgi:hypothetical protein